MSELVDGHLERLESALLTGYDLGQVPRWITENTRLKGEAFSFKDHEYQLTIANDPSREKVIRKCSQIGISEFSARSSLASLNIVPGYTVIYTLPTANFAKVFSKTRLDPIIQGSPKLLAALDPDTDSAEVKRFGESFIYIKGTKGQAAAISVPADELVHDEVDFSDDDVMSNYESRLTHSKYKRRTKLSTPTVEGRGVSEGMRLARRHYNFCKCNHCAHHFLPDYFDHVKVPGYDGSLKEITKENLGSLPVAHARLLCPKCGAEPSLQPEHRQWVVENGDVLSDIAGYQISPFDAPNIITAGSLIVSSTRYSAYTDFINFGLGLPAEDKDSTLTLEELQALFIPASQGTSYVNVLGIDVGLISHFMIGGVQPGGRLEIVHTQRVPLAEFEATKKLLCLKYGVRITVMDSQPYFDLLTRLQAQDSNMWGAVYSNLKDLDIYKMKDTDKDAKKGKSDVRQVDINRNHAFDAVMDFVRSASLSIIADENKQIIIDHLQNMKRVKDYDASNELVHAWKKSARGLDHFHHALLYTYVASRMTGLASSSIILPIIVGSFKNKAA